MKIILISGSLRTNSYNKALLKFINSKYSNTELVDISKIPLFNEDLESNYIKELIDLKSKIKEADGIIISSPEYNHTMTPIIKNTLDWLSRDDSLLNKKVAIMSASLSFIGGARAQEDLKKLLLNLGANVFIDEEVYVGSADKKIKDSVIIDEFTKNSIIKLVDSFINSL